MIGSGGRGRGRGFLSVSCEVMEGFDRLSLPGISNIWDVGAHCALVLLDIYKGRLHCVLYKMPIYTSPAGWFNTLYSLGFSTLLSIFSGSYRYPNVFNISNYTKKNHRSRGRLQLYTPILQMLHAAIRHSHAIGHRLRMGIVLGLHAKGLYSIQLVFQQQGGLRK